MMMRALLFGLLAVKSCGAAAAMEVGTNFWDVGWGGCVYTVFRFMDWGKTNNAVVAHGLSALVN